MIVNKWNFKTKEYEKVEIPDNRKICLYSNNMNETIQCISCGNELKFGDSYASRRYHTEMGLGYCVCHNCYEEEWILESAANEATEDELLSKKDFE